jgi:hypothetical protein
VELKIKRGKKNKKRKKEKGSGTGKHIKCQKTTNVYHPFTWGGIHPM